jgi:hypothetical protein
MREQQQTLAASVTPGASLSVSIQTHLWIWWAQIAIEQETIARDARAHAVEITPSDEGFGEAFTREAHASMIAISAAAHSLDALYGAVKPNVTASTAEKRPMKILEALCAGFEVRGAAGGGAWAREFRWLFDLRDAALHFEEASKPTVPHPAGGNSGVENATYALESTTRAVDFLLEVLQLCVSSPRPPLTSWASAHAHAVKGLRESRISSAPSTG